ncbi:MAG: GNAT family N-acetyltransferase [Acidobacteria bacterium]|nr:GNAT family N-acetyltransferase [Acidobacteriota bacterium]
METGFYGPELDTGAAGLVGTVATSSSDWRRSLPVLANGDVTLRELELSDAPSLLTMLSTEEVTRFISPPPTTIEGFERFIEWTHQQRAVGRCIVFGIVPRGMSVAVGLIQVRSLEPRFSTAEWGFALGSPFWGTGLFMEGAQLLVDFAFDIVGIHRLEARASTRNGRGNGVLRKLGALPEGVLRRSFLRHGEYHDQVLWAILETDWRQAREPWGETVH